MKKWMILLIVICIGVMGCEKEVIDDVDITQGFSLSASEMKTIKYLFDRNQLDYTKYYFYRLQEVSSGGHHVSCWQLANDLPVFTANLIFRFNNEDIFYVMAGNLIGDVDLDTKPRMKRAEVIEKFIDAARQDKELYIRGISPEDIANRRLDIAFGYYNLKVGISTEDRQYIKAWRIQLSEEEYPLAYVNDGNGGIVYYFNGVIIG
jgi:hypothetical protein